MVKKVANCIAFVIGETFLTLYEAPSLKSVRPVSKGCFYYNKAFLNPYTM